MSTAPRPARIGTDPDVTELAELGAAVEVDRAYWSSECRWLLGLPGVGAVAETGEPIAALTADSIVHQVGTAFAPVAGDSDDHSVGIGLLARHLAPSMASGRTVCVDLSAAPGGSSQRKGASERFAMFCDAMEQQLPQALARYDIGSRRLAISLGADHPGLERFLSLRRSARLGRPRLILRLSDDLIRRARDGADARSISIWHRVTDLAAGGQAALSLQRALRPLNVLCDEERTEVALPLSLFDSPGDGAWFCVGLDVVTGVRAGWLADSRQVRRMLTALLRLCDNLVEVLPWPNERLRHDAATSRRMALHLTGIGDLAVSNGMRPAAFETLRALDPWLEFLKRLLIRISSRMAVERGALRTQQIDEVHQAMAATYGDSAARRLRRRLVLRHRHLLALSPYSLLSAAGSSADSCDLLPLIRHADIVSLAKPEGVSLGADAERRLLLATWAVARQGRADELTGLV